ncbi:polysaccharide pyruvyl transferase family protein [Bacteroides reticulotermitis]|uniref:polysaccharide pyruvyl transferase family protein n=1 Tax=Bacteroides reticulotermitis TaxID=1133319 RepID=UPI003A86EBAB
MKEILVINQPIHNRGDESAHRCLIKALNEAFPMAKIRVLFDFARSRSIETIRVQHPNIEYVIIYDEPRLAIDYNYFDRFVKKLYRDIARYSVYYNHYGVSLFLPINRKFAEYVKQADLVINAPGGIDLGGFMNWNDLYRLNICQIYCKKIAYYSRSIGPFYRDDKIKRKFTDKCIDFFKSVTFLSLRDEKSFNIADENNISYERSVDTAFLSIPDPIMPKELDSFVDIPYIVMVPNQLIWHYKYKNIAPQQIDDIYVNICNLLFKQFPDHNLVMIPQLYDSGRNGDYDYFYSLATRLRKERIKIVSDIYSSDIQQKIIRGASLVVGARYHTIIWAINNSRPFISLSYEHKMTGILQELLCLQHSFDLERCLFEKHSEDIYMSKIEELISLAQAHPEAQQMAYSKAQKGFDKFTKSV